MQEHIEDIYQFQQVLGK